MKGFALDLIPILLIFLFLWLWVWMLMDLVRNPKITTGFKVLWGVGFLGAAGLVAILYYFFEYRPANPKKPSKKP